MKNMQEEIADIGWQTVTDGMNEKGYALVSRFLPVQYYGELINKYDNSDLNFFIISLSIFTLCLV
jgi:penicillin V acylase-like amidase (Ntn superfamily)